MSEVHDDLNHPLYEWTQVITHEELHMLVDELAMSIKETKWYQIRERLMLQGALNAISILLIWLHYGKPKNGITLRQGSPQ